MVSGTIIAESIRPGATLDVQLSVRQIRRGGPERLSAKQEAAGIPLQWTLIEFEVDDSDALPLANALADVLDDGLECPSCRATIAAGTPATSIVDADVCLSSW